MKGTNTMLITMFAYQYERQQAMFEEYSVEFMRPNEDKQTMDLA